MNKPNALSAKDELKRSLRLDFGQAITLCYCCGQELLRSGSKWSVFFCNICKEQIMQFNSAHGFALVPIGRHSLMNNIDASSDLAEGEKGNEEFASPMLSFFERIEFLYEWKRSVIKARPDRMGLSTDTDVRLDSYLSKLPRSQESKLEAVRDACDFMLAQSHGMSGASEEIQAGEDVYCQYTPEKELRCVFITLVIRNQALEKKYPGGHSAFLDKYGGEHNDEITLNVFMAGDYGLQVEDLEKNGLVANEDFVLLDVGIPFEIEGDHVPFNTSVKWLGGCYKKGGVAVFLIH